MDQSVDIDQKVNADLHVDIDIIVDFDREVKRKIQKNLRSFTIGTPRIGTR